MSKKNKWFAIIVIFIIVLITLVLYLQSRPNQPTVGEADQQNNEMLKFHATKEDISNTIQVKGKSSYVMEQWVYPPFTAVVKKWVVSEGMLVHKGDVLFHLEDGKLRDSIELMKANQSKQALELKLRDMRKKLAQAQNVVESSAEQGIIQNGAFEQYADSEEQKIQAELDRVQQDVATAELTDNQSKLANAQYKATETGIFLFQDKKEPQRVTEETPIGKIVDTSKLQLICTVGEYEVFQIQPGMEVAVSIDALKQAKVKGKVERISKFAKTGTDQGSGAAQFEVIISLENNAKLIAGLSLTGSIQTEKKKDATVVPTLAILREQEQYFVYIERNGNVEKQTIKVGLETPDKTEVLEGVQAGDSIVLK